MVKVAVVLRMERGGNHGISQHFKCVRSEGRWREKGQTRRGSFPFTLLLVSTLDSSLIISVWCHHEADRGTAAWSLHVHSGDSSSVVPAVEGCAGV